MLYEGHKIHILLDEYRNKLKLIVDSERVSDFNEISQWANVRETATKHIKLLLTAIQVEVICLTFINMCVYLLVFCRYQFIIPL